MGLRARRRPAARRRQIREHPLGTVDRQGVPHRQLEPVAEHHDRRERGRRQRERDVHLHPRALGSRRVLSPGVPRHRRPDGARHRRRRAECPEAGAVDRRRARGGRRHGAVHGDPGHRERKPGGGPLPHEQRHGAGGRGLRRGRRHADDPRGDDDRVHRGADHGGRRLRSGRDLHGQAEQPGRGDDRGRHRRRHDRGRRRRAAAVHRGRDGRGGAHGGVRGDARSDEPRRRHGAVRDDGRHGGGGLRLYGGQRDADLLAGHDEPDHPGLHAGGPGQGTRRREIHGRAEQPGRGHDRRRHGHGDDHRRRRGRHAVIED